ncbi:MFS transporter, partial [Salmonella enterica subsp. enterica]|nr:MFS transporter [Salmonella enterica subsp. enterica]
LTSGQLAHSVRPGLIMLVSTVGSFLAVGLFAIMPVWIAGVICLALFGWLSAISSLLQYTLLQTQTPENMLGRMNGLWTAQNVTGDAIGAALLGGLGAMMTPVASASVSGFGLVIIGLLLLLVLGELRRFRQTPPVSDAG